jgi:hypothetical protein
VETSAEVLPSLPGVQRSHFVSPELTRGVANTLEGTGPL